MVPSAKSRPSWKEALWVVRVLVMSWGLVVRPGFNEEGPSPVLH